MYQLKVKPEADRIFKKLSKKNKKFLVVIDKKIKEIRKNPFHKYKHLKKPLQGYRRVHIDDSFVLIFRINHIEESVDLYFFGHHDEVYQWRPKE